MNLTHSRFDLLQNWLRHQQYSGALEAIAGDASARRFYRLRLAAPDDQSKTLIAIDAPPPNERVEDIKYALNFFSNSAYLLFPKIYQLDAIQGFALMDDFGDELLIKQLQKHESSLYKQALLGLVEMQKRKDPLPQHYSSTLLGSEMQLFQDWLLTAYLESSSELEPEWTEVKQNLIQSIQAHPQVVVHRDFHSRNLLCCNGKLGVIDFQDVVYGSYVYDVVSLLRDAYYESTCIEDHLRYFHQISPLASQHEFTDFEQQFYTVCVQRQLKVAGIFARLYLRDGKENYLPYIPRVLDYLLDAATRVNQASGLVILIQQVKAQLLVFNSKRGISCKP